MRAGAVVGVLYARNSAACDDGLVSKKLEFGQREERTRERLAGVDGRGGHRGNGGEEGNDGE